MIQIIAVGLDEVGKRKRNSQHNFWVQILTNRPSKKIYIPQTDQMSCGDRVQSGTYQSPVQNGLIIQFHLPSHPHFPEKSSYIIIRLEDRIHYTIVDSLILRKLKGIQSSKGRNTVFLYRSSTSDTRELSASCFQLETISSSEEASRAVPAISRPCNEPIRKSPGGNKSSSLRATIDRITVNHKCHVRSTTWSRHYEGKRTRRVRKVPWNNSVNEPIRNIRGCLWGGACNNR